MDAYVPCWHEIKNPNRRRNRAPTFAANHKHPFPLPVVCGIGYLPDAASTVMRKRRWLFANG